MSKTSIIVIIVIGVLIAGGLAYWYSAQGPSYPRPAASQPTQPTITPSSAPSQSMSAPLPVTTVTVTYTDNGFSPSTVTIPKGGAVIFKNAASDAVWVASNPHPLHNGYPTTGGCIGSTFDACKPIPPGSSWSFTFNFVGHWRYHNHLNPSEGGTVIVQ